MADYTVGSAVSRMAEHMAALYYWLTKEMVADYGEEAACETIRRAVREFGLERGRNIRDEVLKDGEPLTIENLDRYYDIPVAEGWSNAAVYENGEKHNTTASCTFADVWMERGWTKIGQIYCLVDPAIREGYTEGHEPALTYTTDKNVMRGDGCCTSVTGYKPGTGSEGDR